MMRSECEPRTILDDAHDAVEGPRLDAYGHPAANFSRVAELWTLILNAPVEADQVALCMIALKISRYLHGKGRDDLIDIAGYARNIEMIAEVG